MKKISKTEKINKLNELTERLSKLDAKGFHSVSVIEMENLIHDFEEAFKDLSLSTNAAHQEAIISLYTRMAATFYYWLSEAKRKLTIEFLLFVSLKKYAISNIFFVSGFNGKESLLSVLADSVNDGVKSFSGEGLILSLALSSLDELTPEMLNVAFELSDEIKVPLFLGWLNQSVNYTQQAEINRALIIRNSGLLAAVKPNYRMIQCFINAWMLCSYANCADRHQLKISLNKMVRAYLFDCGIKETSRPYQLKPRPKMLIAHERFNIGHAMHRCYAPYIEKLADYFDIVFVGEEGFVEKKYDYVKKNIIIEPDSKDLTKVVDIITSEQPDVIFFPSLGMSHYTICLANLRLAPVQIMTQGHPASSFSPFIDYIFLFNPDEHTSSLVSERIIKSTGISFKQEKHPNYSKEVIKRIYPQSGNFKIAINATAMKINGDFIQACKDIQKQTKRKLEFNFFPALSGLEYDSFVKKIKKEIPLAKVHLPMPYNHFLKKLATCHLSLAPFPFGNSNSTVDALLANIPVVALHSSDIAGLTDKQVLEQLSLESIGITQSVEEYIARSCEIIDDMEIYNDFCLRIESSQPAERLIRKDDSSDESSYSDFARLFTFVFDYHQQIQSSSAKLIDYSSFSKARLYRESLKEQV